MKKLLALMALVWFAGQAIGAVDVRPFILDGPPGNRRVRDLSELTPQDAKDYGPLLSACFKSPKIRQYLTKQADLVDDLLGQVAELMSTTKSKGERGRRKQRLLDDIRGVLPVGSTPITPRSTSSESVSPDAPAGAGVRALSPFKGAVDRFKRALSPGGGRMSPTDPLQTPVKDKLGAGTGSAGQSRSSSVARSRFSFASTPGTPDRERDDALAMKAKITALEEQLKVSQRVGGGGKLAEEQAKVKSLTSQLGIMMEEVAKVKAENAAFEERLRAATRTQGDKDREKTALSARVEALIIQLEREQKERLALTNRLSSTQNTNAELLGRVYALEGGGRGAISAGAAHSASSSDLLGASGKPKRGWSLFGGKPST
jgi:hypothetical protein